MVVNMKLSRAIVGREKPSPIVTVAAAILSFILWELALPTEKYALFYQLFIYLGEFMSGPVIVESAWFLILLSRMRPNERQERLEERNQVYLSAVGIAAWFMAPAVSMIGDLSLDACLSVGSVIMIACVGGRIYLARFLRKVFVR